MEEFLLVTLIVFETTTSDTSRVPLCASCFKCLGGSGRGI